MEFCRGWRRWTTAAVSVRDMTPSLAPAGVLEEVSRTYNRRVMNNVHRSHYVEAIVALVLRDSGWRRMTPWDSWDCEHESLVRLEVKQSAFAQGWGRNRSSAAGRARGYDSKSAAARSHQPDVDTPVRQVGHHAVGAHIEPETDQDHPYGPDGFSPLAPVPFLEVLISLSSRVSRALAERDTEHGARGGALRAQTRVEFDILGARE